MAITFKNEAEKLSKEEKKVLKNKDFWPKFFFILSFIAAFILLSYNFLPIAGALFGFILFFVWFVIVFIGSVISLGLLWLNDGFINFEKGLLDFANNCMSAPQIIIDSIKPYFLLILFVTTTFVVLGLIFSISRYKKSKIRDEKPKKGRLIASIILTSIFFVLVVVGFIFTYK